MKKQLIVSLIISMLFLSAGFVLLHYGLLGYGFSFFVFLPFILGYVLGGSTLKKYSFIGLMIALAIFCFLLYIGELEGMICILMSFPLIMVAAIIGFLVHNAIRANSNPKSKPDDHVKTTILPFLLFISFGFLENIFMQDKHETLEVKTEIILPNTTFEVYDAIKSVDTVIADKTFLMKLDLPVPVRCVLENESVGGIRTCHFTGGFITERITELERGKVLKMDVIDYQLTGRKWLGFEEAIYFFKPIGTDSCLLTRITTYSSELHPRFYWEPLEKWAINEEHEYVFEHLKKDLADN